MENKDFIISKFKEVKSLEYVPSNRANNTGIGKTFTGVSAALKLKERINNELNFNPRIIYSLPFLTIVDQNSDTISSILNESSLNGSNFLLNHNQVHWYYFPTYLWFVYLHVIYQLKHFDLSFYLFLLLISFCLSCYS